MRLSTLAIILEEAQKKDTMDIKRIFKTLSYLEDDKFSYGYYKGWEDGYKHGFSNGEEK